MAKRKKIDDIEALDHLDELDAKHQVNTMIEVEKTKPPVKRLGKINGMELSAAEESPWKLLSFSLLPSKGRFYPDGSELLIKSAKTKEIRHWSTMDEHDPIDVREKINFILNKCTKFKIKGEPIVFNFGDFNEVDKYHILFRIHELTFPNQENKLMANVKCQDKKCNHINKVHVGSQNLIGFDIPEHLLKWYSDSDKEFIVPSEKLNETLRFNIPTIGITNLIRKHKQLDHQNGMDIDESFYEFIPYIIKDFREVSQTTIFNLKMESNNWSENKFLAIYKFTEEIKEASINKVSAVCEKCKSQITSSIFLGESFTVKDIFIISTRFNEFI